MKRMKPVTLQKLPGEMAFAWRLFNQPGKPKPATEILASEIRVLPTNSK